ncbi:MAG: DUF6320 domain-containing protein [Clostridia bacterium]
MSYCVNCGVELAPSEKKCPLCGVVLTNPLSPWCEPEKPPYPETIELKHQNIDSRYGATLGTMLLSIPSVLTLLGNLIINNEITWSLYVIGACACLFVYILLPSLLKKRANIYILLGFDVSITLLYLMLIEYLSGTFETWVLSLGAPITLIIGLFAVVATFVIRRKRIHGLYKPAIILPLFSVSVVAIEITINYFLTDSFVLRWSLYVLSVFCVIGILLSIIEKNQNLKDEIKRRLFV